jgi:hypothetical protein
MRRRCRVAAQIPRVSMTGKRNVRVNCLAEVTMRGKLRRCYAGLRCGVAGADGGALADWAVSRPASGNPVIAPRPGVDIYRPDFEEARALGGAAHVQSRRRLCAMARSLCFIARKTTPGRWRLAGTRRGWAGGERRRDSLHAPRCAGVFPAKDKQKAREWPGGVEDPRIVESEDGTYVLTYTQWNRKTYSVGIATSRDLTHWTKHGPAFLKARAASMRS